jgi:hypothetical protein
MMNKFTFTIVVVLLVASCNIGIDQSEYDKLKAEYNKIKVELTECKKTVEELENTPQVRLSNGQQFLLKNDIPNAKKEFNALITKFGGTDEAIKAISLLAAIERQEQEKKEVEEQKRALGFKILKENTSVNVGAVTLKFNSISTGQQWIFDNYGNEWRYKSAEREEKYVLAKVSISSDNKDPELPPIGVYRMINGTLSHIGTMGYEFSRWDDYASYLGNNHDFKNDFSHTETISFSLGLSVSNESITNNAIFLVVKKENCFIRSTDRFDNPPVSYNSNDCNLKSSLSVDDFDNDYVLVKIFNKNKL